MSNENKEPVVTLNSCIHSVSDNLDADIYVLSGGIDRNAAYALMGRFTEAQHRTNCLLILTTYGGDPDGAYMIARFLQRAYTKFTVYVCGFCKSAGTLIVLGASEIVMTLRGELGPLDVQMYKEDVLVRQNSGLDIVQAIKSISTHALSLWEDQFLQILNSSQGIITTRTAADIASLLATQFFSPIVAQIDPLRLGEIQRAIDVASKYGELLGAQRDTVQKLIYGYPSHGFVIDIDEAIKLFGNVRVPTSEELTLAYILSNEMKTELDEECIWSPHSTGVILCLTKDTSRQIEKEGTTDGTDEKEILITSDSLNGLGESNNEEQSPTAQTSNTETI